MQYSQLLDKLFSLNQKQGVKLGLEQMQHLCQSLNNPHKRFQTIHIAGTNGKGSVAAKIAKGLESKYSKVGLFTSPHISTFRERIRINGEMIDIKSTELLLNQIIDLPGTFFELTTLLAFLYFAEKKVDIAVIETGLGGRLDATNIITPSLSIITSISLDHTEFLGNSLDEIAREKAGIIKPGIPVILGPSASLIHSPQSIQVNGPFNSVEEENRAIAQKGMELLEVPNNAIQQALATRLPCRREVINDVILDVAHNPEGISRFFEETEEENLQVICGLSSNKDLEVCLQTIHTHAKEVHLVDASNGRCASPESLRIILMKQGVDELRIHCYRSIAEALNTAKSKGKTAVIGTFFIMDEARQHLGVDAPKDTVDLNERFIQPQNIQR